MLQYISKQLFQPHITYKEESLSSQTQKELYDFSEGEFIAKYTIPSSIIPQLQARFILTTTELLLKQTKYNDALTIPLADISTISEESSYIRIHTSNTIYEIKYTTEEGEQFKDTLLEQHQSIANPVSTEGLHKKSIESLEEKFST